MLGLQSTARTVLMLPILLTAITAGWAGDGAPPSFVPDLVLSYVDPQSGEEITCGEGCRRFEVPDGVDLEVRVRVHNRGGDVGDEGVAWDLWLDQRYHPFPGLDLSACHDPSVDRLDRNCWLALNDRVDWEEWHGLVSDVVCVPEKPGVCEDVTVRVPMDLDYDGSRGRGVYSIALWVDRFRWTDEDDEFDNFEGPVRVKVVPSESRRDAASTEISGSVPEYLVMSSSTPQPYTVVPFSAEAERDISLGTSRSRGTLEFAPLYRGPVTVEVVQFDLYESMVVEVRKVSTGEVLIEATERGRVQLTGELGYLHLKDDRRFEVTVNAAHGARGVRARIRSPTRPVLPTAARSNRG